MVFHAINAYGNYDLSDIAFLLRVCYYSISILNRASQAEKSSRNTEISILYWFIRISVLSGIAVMEFAADECSQLPRN